MIDLYLFNTIINTIWYLFTILFILYKFTTFFSHTYNFFRFCGKLISSGKYIFTLCTNYFNQKTKLEETIVIDETEKLINSDYTQDNSNNNSFIKSIKNTGVQLYYKCYYKIFGKHHPYSNENYVELPLYNSNNNLSDLHNLNNDIINSYSKNQNYNSLMETQSHLSNYFNNQSDKVFYYKHLQNSNMLQTIPLNKSNNDLRNLLMPKSKPFGLNNSATLFESSFINNQLYNDKSNLPFAIGSDKKLGPLKESIEEHLLDVSIDTQFNESVLNSNIDKQNYEDNLNESLQYTENYDSNLNENLLNSDIENQDKISLKESRYEDCE